MTVFVWPPPRCRAATMPTAAAQPSTDETTATGISAFHCMAQSVRIAPQPTLKRRLDFRKPMRVYACIRDRLVRLARDGGDWSATPALEGERLQCVAARGDTVLVG